MLKESQGKSEDESEDESEKPTSIYLGREEIRGLFTLGFLAVVTSVRIQYLDREISILINGTLRNITYFFDAMIILWSFYAFFMVLGLSDDMIGEKGSRLFRRTSRYYLYGSYVILGMLAVAFYFSIFPLQATGLSIIVGALAIYWFGRQLYLLKKSTSGKEFSIKSLSAKVVSYLGSKWYQLFGVVFIGCLLLVLFGTHDEFVIPASVIGSIFLILFLVLNERSKRKRKEQVQMPSGEPASANETVVNSSRQKS